MRSRQRPTHAQEGDSGATLIFALIIITVVSMVTAALLSFSDTSLRTTIALRDQGSDVYAADGATQAVLNALKTSGITCSSPSSPGDVTLGSTTTPFYTPVSSVQGSVNAYARCSPDPITGAGTSTSISQPPPVTTVTTVTPPPPTSSSGPPIGLTNEPTDAILTVGQGSQSSEGQTYGGNNSICIEGGTIRSNSFISTLGSGNTTLHVQANHTNNSDKCPNGTTPLTVAAFGTCNGPASSYTPTPCTHMSSVQTIPSAPPPSGSATLNQAAVCQTSGSTRYAAFLPGKYTLLTSSSQSSMNTPCKNGSNWVAADVDWFTPGTYFFDLNGGGDWNAAGTVIGGTPTKPDGSKISGLDGTNAATLGTSTLSNLSLATSFPGACANPSVQNNYGGVEFVFGGASRVNLPAGNKFELCATYIDPNSCVTPSCAVPVAVFGNPVSGHGTTIGTVTTESSSGACFATSGCAGGSMFETNINGASTFHVQGYVYAPDARVELTFKNQTDPATAGQVFNWGLLLRAFNATVNGSSQSIPFVQLPATSVGIVTPTPYPSTVVSTPAPVASVSATYTIRYVNVWICTVASLQASGQPSCPSGSPPNVQARVLTDANGVPQKVLSWNHIR
jgi:hypothetical protein